MSDVRPCAVAGQWYPGDAADLQRAVDGHLSAASVPQDQCPCAIIAPHAGLLYSGPVAAHAYKLVSSCGYKSVVLVGPSHFVGFAGVSIWPRGAWSTPSGPVPIDEKLAVSILARSREIREHPVAHAREHSLEMQMPFIATLLPGVPIVPLVMGHQTRKTCEGLGRALAESIAEAPGPILMIASTDLSHYRDSATASRMDASVLRHVDALDPEGLMTLLEKEPEHACGGGPTVSVLHAARRLGASRASVLRYADSGDVSGDKTAVVGYMAAGVW